MRHPTLQQFVVDVLAVRSENRAPSNQAAQDGESGLQDGQPERNYRNGDCDYGRRLLCAFQGKSAEHEPDEKASAVAEEDGRGIEVEAQETENGAREGNRQQRDHAGTAEDRNDENHQG